MVRDVRLVLVLVAVAVAGLSVGGASAADAGRCPASGSLAALECAAGIPVPSLEPAATQALWRSLVRRPARHRLAAAQECRPLRAVFYAASDWLRLATKLAEAASPCAQYYISVPPLASDKTRPRPDQAGRIRALGPNFHALAEIHMVTWGRWVASTGSTWHQAGVEVRRRMAAAGYDVSRGDTWAVNELNSAVRRGDGSARTSAREFLRGLYEGEGAPARGVAWIVGVGQRTPDPTTYKVNLQGWFQDAAFWSEMSAYVSDWSQEVYGDVRSYAVPDSPLEQRRDRLSEYLQHEVALARAGPDAVAAARSFLQAAYSPLANAAWQWDFGYGWTMVGPDEMKDFVSAQVYALRHSAAAAGTSEDRWGFAWAPRNASSLAPGDYAGQTRLLLERLAVAIRDSAETGSDPGVGACGPPGQILWCNRSVDGAAFTDGWRAFATWTTTGLVVTSPAQTIAAGAVSAPLAAQLQTAGVATPTTVDLPVTFSSSSSTGVFSTSPSGPWTSTLTVTIPAGGNAVSGVFYQDTRAGSHVLTVSAPGVGGGTHGLTVVGGEPVALTITPEAVSQLLAGGRQTFTAGGTDGFGNVLTGVNVTWSVTPATLGTISPVTGPTTTFIAGTTAGTGDVTATATTSTGTLTATAFVTVIQPSMRVRSVGYRRAGRVLYVTVDVRDETRRPVPRAAVSIVLYRNGVFVKSFRRTTTSTGQATFSRKTAVGALRKPGCYRTRVSRVAAVGFRWTTGTPTNRFCLKPSKRR